MIMAAKYSTEEALKMLDNSFESESGYEMSVDNCIPSADCDSDASDDSYVEQRSNGSDYDSSSSSMLQYSDNEDRNVPDGDQSPVEEETECGEDNGDNLVNEQSSEGSEETQNGNSSTIPKTRKRTRNPETWVKTKRSKLRNSGKAYKTKSGKHVLCYLLFQVLSLLLH